jgi:hypothetical protein
MAKLLSISNSNLLRIVFKLFLFVIIILAMDMVLSIILSNSFFHGQGKNTRINYTLKQRRDIVIFGASRAYHHYIPPIIEEETGYTVYNAGEDSKNATYELALLELILQGYTPKIIVYEISDFSRNFDRGNTELYPFYYKNQNVRSILLERDRYARIRFMIHLYAYNQKLYRLLVDAFIKSKPDHDGYSPLYGIIRKEEISKSIKEQSMNQEPKLDTITLNNFIKLIKVCKTHNIKLVFVESPLYFGESAKFYDIADSLARTNDIPFFKYYKDSHFLHNDRLFKDAGHLNNDGAILFSKIFGKDLHDYLLKEKSQAISKP